MSGLLSAVVIFATWQTPPLNSMKSECSGLSGRYTCMHGSIYKCGEMAAYSIFSPNTGWTSVFSLRNTDKHLHSYLHKLALLQCVRGVLLHHVACHLYHILYVLPVNISVTSSMCCTCQQSTHSLSSLSHPLCVVPVNRPHSLSSLPHPLCVVPVNRPHIACHLYHILYVLYLSTDHT